MTFKALETDGSKRMHVTSSFAKIYFFRPYLKCTTDYTVHHLLMKLSRGMNFKMSNPIHCVCYNIPI